MEQAFDVWEWDSVSDQDDLEAEEDVLRQHILALVICLAVFGLHA